MKNKLLKYAAYAAAIVMSIGCTQKSLVDKEPDIPVIIAPEIQNASGPNVDITRAKVGNFIEGDQLGLYLVETSKNNFADAGNYADNHKMTTGSDGKIHGTNLYYYGRNAVVDFYSYYPYQEVSNPSAMSFSVATNQRETPAYNKSDLLYAVQNNVSPINPNEGEGVAKLSYKHKMCQLLFELQVASTIGGRKVESISAVRVADVQINANFNIKTGDVSAPTSIEKDNIDSYVNGNQVAGSSIYLAKFAAIIPPQTIATNSNFIAIDVKFEGVTNPTTYWYSTSSAMTLNSGYSITYNLSISDSQSAIQLDTEPEIGDWTENDITIGGNGNGGGNEGSGDGDFGGLSPEINNNFTVLWNSPVAGYGATTEIKVTIKNPVTQQTVVYTPVITSKDTSDNDLGVFKFTINDKDAQFGYPYQIAQIEFRNAEGGIIETCGSFIGATVPAAGNYTIGITINNLVSVTGGNVTDWEDLFTNGNVAGAGVVNGFTLRLMDGGFTKADIDKIEMIINNTTYSWNVSSLTFDIDNKVYLQVSGVNLPTTTAGSPTSYPYTINTVIFKQGANVVATCTSGLVINSMGSIFVDLN